MKEYIEREAAIFDLEIYEKQVIKNEYALAIAGCRSHIRDIPAADVVEVVRCKECRYFYNGSTKCCTNHVGVVLTDENGFCHHAKRREDEGGNA